MGKDSEKDTEMVNGIVNNNAIDLIRNMRRIVVPGTQVVFRGDTYTVDEVTITSKDTFTYTVSNLKLKYVLRRHEFEPLSKGSYESIFMEEYPALDGVKSKHAGDSISSLEYIKNILDQIVDIHNEGPTFKVLRDEETKSKDVDWYNAPVVYSTYIASFSYTNSKDVLLPNDRYYTVSNIVTEQGELANLSIIRIVRLKPFIFRIIPTLLYGRSHPSNFSYIESNQDYQDRVIKTIDDVIGKDTHFQTIEQTTFRPGIYI